MAFRNQQHPQSTNKLSTFHQFPELPLELRLIIWKLAISHIPPQVLSIQPLQLNTNTPALVQVCQESRDVCRDYYNFCIGRQERQKFRIFINYEKDTVYLNRQFSSNDRRCRLPSLCIAGRIYRDWLKPIKYLAINKLEIPKLTSAYRGGSRDIWAILQDLCPGLEILFIVENAHTQHLKIRFRDLPGSTMYGISGNLFAGGTRVDACLEEAQKRGLWKNLRVRMMEIEEGAPSALVSLLS